MIDRITYPRLRRQVHHDLRFLLFKQLAQHFPIRNVAPHKIEGSTVLPSTGFLRDPQPLLLERDIVIIIHLIDATDLSTCFQQPFGQVKSDKARSSCNQICFLWVNPILIHVLFTPAPCASFAFPSHLRYTNPSRTLTNLPIPLRVLAKLQSLLSYPI